MATRLHLPPTRRQAVGSTNVSRSLAKTTEQTHHAAGGQPNGGGQIAVAFTNQVESPFLCETALPVTARNGDPGNVAVAFAQNQIGEIRVSDTMGTLATNSNASGRSTALAMVQSAVRRLTPMECERLQGFPDGYTAVPYRGRPASDGPRYRALGNSMAVPCMEYIGRRIQMVEEIV